MEVISAPVLDPAAAASPGNRWIGVGTSSARDSREAGIAAATTALGEPIPGCWWSSSRRPTISRRCSRAFAASRRDTRLIGCSTAGEIATEGPSDASVVVTAIGGSGFTVATRVARNASSRSAPGRCARRELRRERAGG